MHKDVKVVSIWVNGPHRVWLFDNGKYYDVYDLDGWSIDKILSYGYRGNGNDRPPIPLDDAQLVWPVAKCNCDVCCEE